ncbi:MAG: hypothetical protein GY697_17150 [Desulfobacterales bacterium]|nr:hypothetical protein [Desulfobacterales bacterium]
MEHRKLGKSDIEISPIIMGTWQTFWMRSPQLCATRVLNWTAAAGPFPQPWMSD